MTSTQECGLVRQAVELSTMLSTCTVDQLSPFTEEIENISKSFGGMVDKLQQATRSQDEDPVTCPAETESSMPEDRQVAAVVALFSASTRLIPRVVQALWCIDNIMDSSAPQTPRLQHIQNILYLQRRRPSVAVHAREKLLLLCACRSIALDFCSFERSNGWKPKQDQIIERVLQGRKSSVQTIGKHLRNYVASMSFVSSAERAKFDSAIRLGIKLQVVDAIGQANELDSSLSLLLGFECVKFTRLSYDSFGQIQCALENDQTLRRTLATFTKAHCRQWQLLQTQYHDRFGTGDRRGSDIGCRESAFNAITNDRLASSSDSYPTPSCSLATSLQPVDSLPYSPLSLDMSGELERYFDTSVGPLPSNTVQPDELSRAMFGCFDNPSEIFYQVGLGTS